jgi:hypothetical protein
MIVMICLSVVSIFILISGLVTSETDIIGFGVGSVLFVTLIGWGLLGSIIVLEHKSEKLETFYTKSEKSIILEEYGNSKFYYFDKKLDFDYLTDTTAIYLDRGYNMYGIVSGVSMVYYYDTNNVRCIGKIKH